MQTTESFWRGRIADAITPTQTVPFTLAVSKVPNNENQYITISPDTENEEIFYYTTTSWTIWEAGTLNITKIGIKQENNFLIVHCEIFDFKFLVLSHNTVRGAAGGTLLIAELMKANGYLEGIVWWENQ